MRQSSTRSSWPPSEVTASTSNSAPAVVDDVARSPRAAGARRSTSRRGRSPPTWRAGALSSAAATAPASTVSPHSTFTGWTERAVPLGHVGHPSAERAGDADDHVVARLGQVGHAGLHAGAAGPRHRERQPVLGPEHLLQKPARLVHDAQVGGVEVAQRRRGQRRQHARRDRARPRAEQDALGERSMDPHLLAQELGLQMPDVELAQADAVLDRDRRRDAGALAGHRAAHHAAHGGVRDLVARDAAPGDQQVLHLAGAGATP